MAKNTNYSIKGHTFFGDNWCLKSWFWALFVILDFLGPKEGRGPTLSLDPQIPTKKLTHLVEFLGHPLSRNHVSNFSDLGNPPPPLNTGYLYI